jgi:carbonic anhydrase/acetyltransferase-like protein (isoleucine patch superfamily)
MNAVVMDGADIGESAIAAAMSFVKAGMQVPPRSLVLGSPARVVRQLTDEEIAWKRKGTREYQQLAVQCLQQMEAVAPLTAVEPDRRRLRNDDPHSLVKPKSDGVE